MLSEETDSNRRHIVPLFKIEVSPSISLTKLSNIFQKIGKWKFVSSWMVVGQFAWIIIESDLRLTIRIDRITYARSRLMSVLSFQWNGSQFHSFLRRLLLKNPSKHFCRCFWSPLTLSKNYISSFLFFLKQLEIFVGLPRFELGISGPKSDVLPLHHRPLKYSWLIYNHEHKI